MNADHRTDHDDRGDGRTLPDPALGLGTVIRLLREAAGMSQKELAYRIGTSASYLSQIEAGERKWPRKYIAGLAQSLDVTPSYLGRAARKIVDDAEFAPERPVPSSQDAARSWMASVADESPPSYAGNEPGAWAVDALRREITAMLPAVPDHLVAALHTIVATLARTADRENPTANPAPRVRTWSSLMRRLNQLTLDEYAYHALLDWVTTMERLQATGPARHASAPPVPSMPAAATESTPPDHPGSDPASGPRNNRDESV